METKSRINQLLYHGNHCFQSKIKDLGDKSQEVTCSPKLTQLPISDIHPSKNGLEPMVVQKIERREEEDGCFLCKTKIIFFFKASEEEGKESVLDLDGCFLYIFLVDWFMVFFFF